jgi:hypothetical protein
MGVLACDRRGCKNIMCDRYSYKYGYICHECFEELVNLGYSTNIEEFMGGTIEYERPEIDDYKFFDEEFPMSEVD